MPEYGRYNIPTDEYGLKPCSPRPDTDELASEGERLIMRIVTSRYTVELFLAPKGVMHSGWVVAVPLHVKL